jgi:transcriptional regulator with XRE-family HTH domain
MEEKMLEIAQRIRELREIIGISISDMADVLGMSNEEYMSYEEGQRDFSFTFLYNAAKRFGVDIVELVTGRSPKLSSFSIVRKGEGMPIERRGGFSYQNMAYLFKDRIAEPFVVNVPYDEETAKNPLVLNYHDGQEFDYILKGKLRMRIDRSEFILNEGDAVYYDSAHGHGMAAIEGDCVMLAVVMERKTKGGGAK